MSAYDTAPARGDGDVERLAKVAQAAYYASKPWGAPFAAVVRAVLAAQRPADAGGQARPVGEAELRRLDEQIADLEQLEVDRQDGEADAERHTAGMREVALIRAINARAVQGAAALLLARRLRAALAAAPAPPDDAAAAQVLGEHQPSVEPGRCSCGFWNVQRHEFHQAAALRAAVTR